MSVLAPGESEAVATPGEPEQGLNLPAITESQPSVPQAAPTRELTDLRTADSKTYELADGSREWVGYSEPVHYKDANGAFQEIDNTVISKMAQLDGTDFAYRNAANEYTARFGPNAGSDPLVRIEHDGHVLSLGLVDAKASEADRSLKFAGRILSAIAYAPDCVVYPHVYPGVDLIYEAKSNGVKEYLVLKEPSAQNEFAFDFKLGDLKVDKTDGRIGFVDKNGKAAFWLGDPIALDDAEAATTDITYDISGGEGSCELKVTLSRSFLDDPERVYPVVLDPEVMIYPPTADTYVCSGYPSTNYVSATVLRTGRSSGDGIRRTFIKFTDLPVINPDDVTDAHLRIERNTSLGGVAPLINAWWSLDYFACDSMTWSSGTPHWDGTGGDDFGSPESTQGVLNGGQWYEMHCTTPVRYWLAGTYPNYGWMIKDQRESTVGTCTAFYSSNYGSPHRPELHIVYTQPPPPVFSPPAYTYSDSGCTGEPTDPINILFGGFVGNGYFGTLEGVVIGVTHTDSWWYEVVNTVQYVKFVPTSGSSIIRANTRALGTGELCDRYHMRLFVDPFACSWGYAEKNTVTSAHHEDWYSWDHHIDQDWEDVEWFVEYRLHDLYSANTYFDDVAYNGGYGTQGYDSNGLYSVIYLAP
jgi:hypothetical protein